MNNSHFGRIVLMCVVLSSVITIAIPTSGIVFADKCKNNHDNNCNHSKKSQKLDLELNCDIQIKGGDNSDNNIFGPTDQQCQINGNNIKDSVVQSPSGGGGVGQPGPNRATLIVTKEVKCLPIDPTCAVPKDFTIVVAAKNASPNSFEGSGPPGTEVTLDPGAYSVGEKEKPRFTFQGTPGCDSFRSGGNIQAGETRTCLITNQELLDIS